MGTFQIKQDCLNWEKLESPSKAHMPKAWPTTSEYWELLEPLRHEAQWEEVKSLGMCLWRAYPDIPVSDFLLP